MDSTTPKSTSPLPAGRSPKSYSTISPQMGLRMASSFSSLLLNSANIAIVPGSPRSARSSKASSTLDDLDDVTPPDSQNPSPENSDDELDDDNGLVKRKSANGKSGRRSSEPGKDRTNFTKGKTESNDTMFTKDMGSPSLFQSKPFGSKQSLFAYSANVYSSMHRLKSRNSNDSISTVPATIRDMSENSLAAWQAEGSSLPPVVTQKDIDHINASLPPLLIAPSCPSVPLADEKSSFPRTSQSDTETLDGVTAFSAGTSPTKLFRTGISCPTSTTPEIFNNYATRASESLSETYTTTVTTTNILRNTNVLDSTKLKKVPYYVKHPNSNAWLAFWDRNNDGIIDLFDTLRAFLTLYRAGQVSLPRLLFFLPFLLAIHLTLAIFTSPNGLIMPFRSIKAWLSWPIHITTLLPKNGYQDKDRFRHYFQLLKRLGVDIRSKLNRGNPAGNG